MLDDAFARSSGLRGGAGHRAISCRTTRPGICASAASSAICTKPVLCIPGQSRRARSDAPRARACAVSDSAARYRGAGWQFVMLDSYDPGHVGGRLTRAGTRAPRRARWPDRPQHAMVCLHHHPVDMGSRWLDSIGLANADDFWRVIDSHSHVRAVAWGHVHQELRRRARRRAPVRDPVDRRAIPAEERPLRRRLAAAGVSALRAASRRPHRHRGPLGRIACRMRQAAAAR